MGADKGNETDAWTGTTAGGEGGGAIGCVGAIDGIAIGLTLTALLRVTLGLRCSQEFRITAAIPAKQSSRTAVNKAGTLKSPLPRYRGDWTSAPMVRASTGRTRLLVTETINPQIPSARITAITTRPIHFPVSTVDDSGESILGTSSISCVMQIVPQPHNLGKAVK
jgi:hypothetical protein